MTGLRLLLSREAAARWGRDISGVLAGVPHELVHTGDADIALVTRDITGLSTKHELLPSTVQFYNLMRHAASLRWVHTHSAGADRAIFGELRGRGVAVTTSSGTNAQVVAQSALAGLLALSRHFPRLMAAQRERRWAPLFASGMPRDIAGQSVVLVGWGPVAQALAPSLQVLGMRVCVVRHSDAPAGGGLRTVGFGQLGEVLPTADWLVLACPLTERTRGLVGAGELSLLPRSAHLVNVARGEIVDQAALVDALRAGTIAGAFLDVFEHEPLPSTSPLWDMENVIVTPHSAGFSDGNEARVAVLFLENLRRWQAGQTLRNQSS